MWVGNEDSLCLIFVSEELSAEKGKESFQSKGRNFSLQSQCVGYFWVSLQQEGVHTAWV